MSDIAEAIDAYLTAKVKAAKWEDEFLSKFYGPLAKMMVERALENARTSPMFDRNKLERELSPAALRKLRGE